jgi:hypothetical protein
MLVSGGTVAAGAWVSRSPTNFTQSAILRNLHFHRNGSSVRDFEWVWPW